MGCVPSTKSPWGCCLVQGKLHEEAQVDFLRTCPNRVELAVTPLGGIPGFMAYHTSIIVNGEEFVFCAMGIMRNFGMDSHRRSGGPFGVLQSVSEKTSMSVIDMGMTARSTDMLMQFVSPYFMPGSYDLLLKNCNTFTDAALFFLTGQRLDSSYNSIEKVAVKNPRLLEQVIGMPYQPNPCALGFNVDQVLRDIGEADDDEPLAHGALGRLTAGTVARVRGLQNKEATRLNGKACVVQRFNSKTRRYEVRVLNELKALRGENLEPLLAQQEMIVANLRSDVSKHLNGERCVVVKFNDATDRLEVQLLSTGEVKALKIENVQQASSV